jgi:hypothetical protein
VTVTNVAPTVDAGPDVSVAWGVPLALTAAVHDASPEDRQSLDVSWELGDGATATGASTSHAWAGPGTGDGHATATDRDGGTASDTRTVTVTARPTRLELTAVSGRTARHGLGTCRGRGRRGPLAGRPVAFTVAGGAAVTAVTGPGRRGCAAPGHRAARQRDGDGVGDRHAAPRGGDRCRRHRDRRPVVRQGHGDGAGG